MTEWIWVESDVASTAHRSQLAEHGGGDGIRDPGLFDSAMARPQNLVACGDPDVSALAASYAFRLARSHPFMDGNERTAAVVAETFLILNGFWLHANDAEVVVAFLALAAGELGEEELADWFRDRVRAA